MSDETTQLMIELHEVEEGLAQIEVELNNDDLTFSQINELAERLYYLQDRNIYLGKKLCLRAETNKNDLFH